MRIIHLVQFWCHGENCVVISRDLFYVHDKIIDSISGFSSKTGGIRMRVTGLPLRYVSCVGGGIANKLGIRAVATAAKLAICAD